MDAAEVLLPMLSARNRMILRSSSASVTARCSFPFAALQNVPHDHSGINAIQHIGALLIQLRLGQCGHTAKLCVGFKQVAQLIRFAVFSLGALFP